MHAKTLSRCLAITFLVAGCDADQRAGPAPATSSGAVVPALSASASAQSARGRVEAFLADETAPLTAEIEEALLLELEGCGFSAFVASEIDDQCSAHRAWNARSKRKGRDPEASRRTALKHLGHASPAVRCVSADLLASTGAPEATPAIIDAAAKEQVPNALACFIRTGRFSSDPTAAARDFLSKMSGHGDEHVRITALDWFLTIFGERFPETFDTVVDKLERDPSVEVRAALCRRLYGTENERAVALFTKILGDKSIPPVLHSSCFAGLVAAWTGLRPPRKPSGKAFLLTVQLLEARPRSKTRPFDSVTHGSGIHDLRTAKGKPAYPEFAKAHAEWLTKLEPWYSEARLLKALEDLAVDANADGGDRRQAVETMKALEAPKATFQRMMTACAKNGACEIETQLEAALAGR